MQRPPQVTVVGFTGLAGSGKDTSADMLAGSLGMKFYKTTESFAKPIKDAAKILFNFTDEQLYGSEKEVVDPRWGVTPRSVLQQLGTDFLRARFGDDFFIKHMRQRVDAVRSNVYKDDHLILIPDVRFDNEAEYVTDELGMHLVHVERPGIKKMDHASEAGVSSRYPTLHISNNGSLDQLDEKVKMCARDIAYDIRMTREGDNKKRKREEEEDVPKPKRKRAKRKMNW